MNKEAKFFSIVSYLAGEEYKKVRDLQKKLSEITGSRKCLEDWLPHITLGDGVTISAGGLQKLEAEFVDFAQTQNIVNANIADFGGTENWKGAVENKITPYVIWLEVKVSADLLRVFNKLRDGITSHYDTWLPRMVSYTPHVTLAFADLLQERYRKGMEYLSSQTLEFPFSISHIALVECYGEGNMTSVEYKKFYFQKKP